jgi:hypothetical protein
VRGAGATVVMDDLLTTADLMRMFDICNMTVFNWRKEHGLPFIVIPGHARHIIRYEKNKVLKWASENGKEILNA